MKENEKKAAEAEIEKKTSSIVSDKEVEGVTGGLNNISSVSLNLNEKLSLNSSDKLSLNNKDKLSRKSSNETSLN